VFAAFIGPPAKVEQWLAVVRSHAAGLALHVATRSQESANSFTACLSWLTHDPAWRPRITRTVDALCTTTASTPPTPPLESDRGSGFTDVAHSSAMRIHVEVFLDNGEFRALVPPTTPEQLFWARNSRATFVSTDLRLLLKWQGLDLDDRAVYALLQYGTIPPPLTLSRSIHRVPGGVRLTLPRPPEPAREDVVIRIAPEQELLPPQPGEAVRDALEPILAGVSPSPLLYFSGGIDSGLLAAEMVRLGRSDVRLVTCTFGDDDPERLQAHAMAKSLALEWHEIRFTIDASGELLDRIGRDYAYPFVDISVIPTNFLVNHGLSLHEPGQTVLDGTGADGVFGFSTREPQWRRLLSIPLPLRRFAGSMLRGSRFAWRASRVERVWRLARRSVQMPAHSAAVLALNPFDGVAYNIPAEIRDEIESAIATQIRNLGEHLDPVKQFSVLDLASVCAGEYAAKTYTPLVYHGATPIYPYLRPEVINFALSVPWDERFTRGESKGLLKELLAATVPHELVYRPKHAFGAPERDVFANSALQAAMSDVVNDTANPVIDYCSKPILLKIIRDASRRRNLTWSAYNLLWSVTFLSLWIRQAVDTSSTSPSRRSPR
jgi:asparagine synthase (glutamine-hydrolysing)